jgi:hypothetical protein
MGNSAVPLNWGASSIFIIVSGNHLNAENWVGYTSWAQVLIRETAGSSSQPATYLKVAAPIFVSLNPPINPMVIGASLDSGSFAGYLGSATATQSWGNGTGATTGVNICDYCTGNIYEILLYNAAVNSSVATAISSYAAARYGVHNTFTKQVVMMGDSNTDGSGASLDINYPMQAYPPDWAAFNNGVGGAYLATNWLNQPLTAEMDLLYNGSYSANAMVIMIGTNDIVSGGGTAASVFANLNPYVGQRNAIGWQTIVMPILAVGGAQESVREAYNALLVNTSNYTSPPSAIVDYRGDWRIGGNPIATDFFAGGLHVNAYGAQLLAQYVYRQLNGGTPSVSYSATGPQSGTVGNNITITFTAKALSLGPQGNFLEETITPNDGGAGGTFTPSTIKTGLGVTTATIQYSRPTAGTSSISFTNDGILGNPSTYSFTAN